MSARSIARNPSSHNFSLPSIFFAITPNIGSPTPCICRAFMERSVSSLSLAREGKPVFYFHGFPGSQLDLLLQKGISSKGLKMIGVDRPGFGLSTFHPDRRVSDFATDISSLANHLGIDRFALLGAREILYIWVLDSKGFHFISCTTWRPARARRRLKKYYRKEILRKYREKPSNLLY